MAYKIKPDYEAVGGPKKYHKSRRLTGFRIEKTPPIQFRRVKSEWYQRLSQQLRAARHQRGLSQTTLARSIGSTQATISRFEHGQINLTIDLIDRYLAAVGKTMTTTLIDQR